MLRDRCALLLSDAWVSKEIHLLEEGLWRGCLLFNSNTKLMKKWPRQARGPFAWFQRESQHSLSCTLSLSRTPTFSFISPPPSSQAPWASLSEIPESTRKFTSWRRVCGEVVYSSTQILNWWENGLGGRENPFSCFQREPHTLFYNGELCFSSTCVKLVSMSLCESQWENPNTLFLQ